MDPMYDRVPRLALVPLMSNELILVD